MVFSPYYHKMPSRIILFPLILIIFLLFLFTEMCYISTVKAENAFEVDYML